MALLWVWISLGVSITKKVKIFSKRLFIGIFNHSHIKRSTVWGTSIRTFDGLAMAIFCWHPQVFLALLHHVLYLGSQSVPSVFSTVALFYECYTSELHNINIGCSETRQICGFVPKRIGIKSGWYEGLIQRKKKKKKSSLVWPRKIMN